MRVFEHYVEPITRDTMAAAFKAPFALHGISGAPAIVIMNECSAVELLKLDRGWDGVTIPQRFEFFGTVGVTVPNDKMPDGVFLFVMDVR